MDARQLMDGLELSPKSKGQETKWRTIEVIFYGAERYVLGSTFVKAVLVPESQGFRIRLRDLFAFPADMLIGPSWKSCVVFDVELKFTDVTLSINALNPGRFPRRYEEGQCIGIE